MRHLGLILLIAAAGAGGCSGNDGPAKPPGTENGPCYGNGTCDPGLTCASNTCVELPDLGIPDVAPDTVASDTLAPDHSVADSTGPDVKPDAGQPDAALPDTVVPDAAAPDAPFPDAPVPDVAAPDAAAPDFNPCVCNIGGTCFALFAVDPANPCQRCAPSKSTSSWTLFAGKGCVNTLAGAGTAGYKDGPSDNALFNGPWHVAVDTTGNVYVADVNNHCIRLISNGVVTTLAGTGTAGFKDGLLATAQFNSPRGVAVDSSGKVYVGDTFNHRIRLISGGQVTTIAGSTPGTADGPAATAKFNEPRGLTIDALGKVYVAGGDEHRIRVISTGQVTTLAGTGAPGSKDGPATSATFYYPQDVAIDSGGKIYVAGYYTHRIRVIHAGQVTTLAGTGALGFADGAAATAKFNYPAGLAVAGAGMVIVGDDHNNRVRGISAGKVTTVAGSGTKGLIDGPVATAQFNDPRGIAIGTMGQIYVGDYFNHSVRLITF